MKKEKILELENVTKYYSSELVFEKINLQVVEGEVICLMGKSGSGKSTLLRCLDRLELIDNGIIKFRGVDISNIPLVELRKKIGIVFQDYNLFEHLTVMENLTIGLIKIKKYTKKESQKQALEILQKIDLVDKKDKYPDELSGGQKQRVAIARTLLMNPDILLLDEPTSALDKEMKESVLNLVKKLVQEKRTLIIVSHEEEFLRKISKKIYKLHNHHLISVM